MSGRRLLAAAIVATAAFVAVAVSGAPAASAAFTSAPGAALTIGTVTVHAPGGVTVSVSCAPPTTLTVSWTAPGGPTPTNYTISVTKDQTETTHTKTVPATAIDITFPIPNWMSYTVQIQTGYNSWTSTTSSQHGTVTCP
jgi:hypothetical protein